jgi:hypothetical protein
MLAAASCNAIKMPSTSSHEEGARAVLRDNYERQDTITVHAANGSKRYSLMQPSQDRSGNDALAIRNLMAVRSRQPVKRHAGNAGTEAGVWSTVVVVSHPLQQDGPKMAFMQHDQPVQTLTTNRADQPFAERGATDRIHSSRVSGPRGRARRAPSSAHVGPLYCLLPANANSPLVDERRTDAATRADCDRGWPIRTEADQDSTGCCAYRKVRSS